MALYSNTNEIVDTKEFTYFDKGNCAKVYSNGEILLKVYNHDCDYRFFLKKNMFDLLKKLNLPSIVKLHDYYFYFTDWFHKFLSMDAYTMDLVKGDNIPLLDYDRTHLIEALKDLEETLEILSDNHIVLWDVNPRNIIISSNGITIIDPDQFFKSRFHSKKRIYESNKKELINCLNSTLFLETLKRENMVSTSFIINSKNSSFIDDVSNSLHDDTFYHSMKSKHR